MVAAVVQAVAELLHRNQSQVDVRWLEVVLPEVCSDLVGRSDWCSFPRQSDD